MLTSNSATQISGDPEKLPPHRRLMLFELHVGGHYAAYVLHLIRYWRDQKLPGQLDVIVTPKFLQQHSDIVDIARDCERGSINFVAITPEEEASLIPRDSPIQRAKRALQDWKLLCKYARSLGTTQCLILYFDTTQTPLALGLKPPCPVSGIYFRPTFHYKEFASNNVLSRKEQLQQWREKFILPRILHHSHLQTLFCLDPFAVKHMDKFHSKAQTVYLPDPVQVYNHSETKLEKLRESLGIEPGRQVFLLFGVIDERKGIHQLLEAIPMLAPQVREKLCLLLVGPFESQAKTQIQSRLAEISQSLSVQVISCDRYVCDREIQPYLQIADVILATYRRHVGMSSILVRSAAALKPVLSSDYGLMGEITRRYGLGLTIDSTSPSEIARGMTQFLENEPTKFGDRNKMSWFAQENSAEKFASVIFQHFN